MWGGSFGDLGVLGHLVVHFKLPTGGGGKKTGATQAPPLGERARLAKAHGVVLQGLPKNLQHIALGRFYAAVDFKARKALGLRNDAAGAAFDGGFKIGVLAGVDTDVGNFKNNGACPYGVGEKDG